MAQRLLVDTDVLVDYLRAVPQAVAYMEEVEGALLTSTVTVAELFAGVREGRERQALEAFLGVFDLLPVDEEIARRGGLWRRDYGRSHGVGLADALIAATAELPGAQLVTLNDRHFPMLKEVLVPYRKAS